MVPSRHEVYRALKGYRTSPVVRYHRCAAEMIEIVFVTVDFGPQQLRTGAVVSDSLILGDYT